MALTYGLWASLGENLMKIIPYPPFAFGPAKVLGLGKMKGKAPKERKGDAYRAGALRVLESDRAGRRGA